MASYLAGKHQPQQALASRIIFLAEDEIAVVGFIVGHLTGRFGCDGELQWMFVSPEHRGSGIATRLLGQLAAWFVGQGASRVCVNVETENQRARAFYRRHGARDFNAHWLEWLNIDVARV